MSHRDLIERYFATVWEEGNAEAATDFFTAEAEASGFSAGMSLKPDDIVTMVAGLELIVDSPRIEILRLVEQGEWASVLLLYRATYKRTGEFIEVSGQSMFRVSEGKFVEAHNHLDLLPAFAQIGLLPENLTEQALLGQTG